jgi:hypothetical protein
VKIFRSREEVVAACLPPWQHKAVFEAVGTIEGIFGKAYDPKRGFVVLVEVNDTPEDSVAILGYHMGNKLETTWRQHDCLLSVTLWGNSGDAVTWVCPERPDYAPAVQELLLREM